MLFLYWIRSFVESWMWRLMWRGLMIHQKQLRNSATRKYCLVWIEFSYRELNSPFFCYFYVCAMLSSVFWEPLRVGYEGLSLWFALFSFARNPLISSSLPILACSPVKLQTSHNLMSPNFGHARNRSHTSLYQWFLPPSIFTASSVCVCVCVCVSLSLSLSLVFQCLNNNHLKASHPFQSTHINYISTTTSKY